jgi:hypothetical protein
MTFESNATKDLQFQQLLFILTGVHFDEVLFEVVLPRPQLGSPWTTFRTALEVLAIGPSINMVNGLQVPVEIVGCSKTPGSAGTPIHGTSMLSHVTRIMFPWFVRGLQLGSEMDDLLEIRSCL